MLLAVARLLLEWDAVDHEFMKRWVNWRQTMEGRYADRPATYEAWVDVLRETYASYTLEWAAEETGVDAARIEAVAKGIAEAGHRFASHTWRGANSGNLGGWQRGQVPVVPSCSHRGRGHPGRHLAQLVGQVLADSLECAAPPTVAGTSCYGHLSTRCPITRCRSCCRTS